MFTTESLRRLFIFYTPFGYSSEIDMRGGPFYRSPDQCGPNNFMRDYEDMKIDLPGAPTENVAYFSKSFAGYAATEVGAYRFAIGDEVKRGRLGDVWKIDAFLMGVSTVTYDTVAMFACYFGESDETDGDGIPYEDPNNLTCASLSKIKPVTPQPDRVETLPYADPYDAEYPVCLE